MNDWRSRLDKKTSEKLTAGPFPPWTTPMLATLTHDCFSSPAWIYERKLDGERCLIYRNGDGVKLYSRNGIELNERYPELERAAAAASERPFVADGEVVASKNGDAGFSELQERVRSKHTNSANGGDIGLYLFDLLYYDGHSLENLPLRTRKEILRREFRFGDELRFTPHRREDGQGAYREACRKGWEGIIAKRADSTYDHGRSRHWLKFKCISRQEFVIAGYTAPQGRRAGFGALLIGYYENGSFQYAGKVGTGFDDATLEDLHQKLKSRECDQTAFEHTPAEADMRTHWVKPELIAEIGFTEWSGDARLLHPRFLGLRDDKSPRDVHREVQK